ncbi:MAG TPA: glycosyltransferase family 1 protein [Ardenticatenaceae bacterium]|nr:glycosyltransferase family 1 protein [Ardenticatenaceae bacterium]
MPTIGLNAHLMALRPDYRGAGISHYIYQLLRHLPRADPDLSYTVFTGEGAGDLPGLTRFRTSLPTSRPVVRILWEQLLQPRAVRRAGVDLLHALAYVLPFWLTVPAVVTVYDLTFFQVPERFRSTNRSYLRSLTRFSARRARVVCAISESTRRDVVRWLGVPRNRVAVVYPGCDAHFTPPRAEEVAAFRARRGLPERFVLYLGTLEPRKNVPALVRAYAEVVGYNGRSLPHHLILAGGKGWHYADIFAEVERLGLRDRVHFPGFIPAEEQPLWYAAAEAFAYPSLYEGFGLPVLEAMACGTPVITSTASSLPEVIGDAGLAVPADDEEALAESLHRLLGDASLRATLRERGLQQASRFSWLESARIQARIYRDVLENASRGDT